MSSCGRFFLSFLLLLLVGAAVNGGAKADKANKPRKPTPEDPLRFWFDPHRSQPAAAAELVLAHNPYTVAALRIQGKSLVVWNEPEFAGEEAPPLNPDWLAEVRDRDRKPMPDFRGKAPDEIPRSYWPFMNIYNEALAHSLWVPSAAFAKSAQENANVTFTHMYSQIDEYRGKVIHLQGRLRRVEKYTEIPRGARERGVSELYEAWIALPRLGSHPVCVIFPIPPQGLKLPAENIDRPVEFDGYLIYLYRYRDGRKKVIDTPLLIGPTLVLDKQAPVVEREEPLVSPALLYLFAGFVGAVVLMVVALSWWFRRGDQKVRAHLAQLRAARAIEMLEADGEAENPGDRPLPRE